MKAESRPERPTTEPYPTNGDKPDGEDFRRYYDKLHSGSYTGTPLEEASGFALLLSRKLRMILPALGIAPVQLLEVGCGQGMWLRTWAVIFPGCRVSGCDLSPVAVERARRQAPSARLEVCTQESVPFDDEQFDLVLSIEVIEHVSDADQFVAQLYRVLKPGGLCLLTTPCANPFSLDWFLARIKPGGRVRTPYGVRWYMEDPCHLRRLTSGEAGRIFRRSNFEVVRFYFWAQFFARLDTKYGRYLRHPGKRHPRLRRRLRFLIPLFDLLTNLEWALCKGWLNGADMIVVLRKPEETMATESPSGLP